VLRIEDGEIQADLGVLRASGEAPRPGADLRRRGTECAAGEVVATRGTRIVPALLGLLAAVGADTASVTRRPIVDLFVLGDELVSDGPARDGRIRDALGPMLLPWLAGLGAEVPPPRRVPDSIEALQAALADSTGDLVVTTGSTAAGPHDHLHAVLERLGAELQVDGVDVRPGHPMLLARLADGRPLVGLPGNPLAAVCGLYTLVEPALRGLSGLRPGPRQTVTLTAGVAGHPVDVRLVPVLAGTPLARVGPAMLRGLSAADALAVIPPGGAHAGAEVESLPLPLP
jgi:molybdopterin molybdotransferase